MFGLSAGELLIIGVVILAVVGPAGAAKLLRYIREVNDAKRQLTEAVSIENLVTRQLDGVGDRAGAEAPRTGPSAPRQE